MTVVLTGVDLSPADVVAVARKGERVELAPEGAERMRQARALADATREAGTSTYGLTTGLGVQKRVPVAKDDAALRAFQTLARTEGIIPALESAHAVAAVIERAPAMKKSEVIVVNLSGRGDKDVAQVSQIVHL